jgi:flagellar hook protein FlgE
MVRSLNAGVSGIQQFQSKLDVIGNNIANSNTLGFKSGRADFEDTFSQTLTGGANQIQIGSGVATGAVKSLFQQGTISRTNVPTDMAIDGDGFFVVRNPVSNEMFAARAGAFEKDSQGYLVTSEGYRVQGYSDSTLTVRDDIRIDDTGKPDGDPGVYKSFGVDNQGRIHVTLSGGVATSFVRGQILLQKFQNPNALTKEGSNLYSGMDNAGALAQIEAPGTNGLGGIESGHLEMSNVDIANEFTSLITTQRGFQASARIITTTDEMLQEVVNLKR